MAWAAGSSLKTVAGVISPRARRTHRPSFKSMAGNRITCATAPCQARVERSRNSAQLPLCWARSIVRSHAAVKLHGVMRPQGPQARRQTPRPLTEADAIDIWIARWLRVRRKDLIDRYGCDPRRLYEIWEGKRFVGSRQNALARFAEQHPGLAGQTDFGLHRRIPRAAAVEGQLGLFDAETD